MACPLSISILRKKRDQISGVVVAYEERLREAQADLAHVNAALRLFEASGDPAEFPPYVDLNRVFRRGETTALCMAALGAEGLSDKTLNRHSGVQAPCSGSFRIATDRIWRIPRA